MRKSFFDITHIYEIIKELEKALPIESNVSIHASFDDNILINWEFKINDKIYNLNMSFPENTKYNFRIVKAQILERYDMLLKLMIKEILQHAS